MISLDKASFCEAIDKINDGFIFEEFAFKILGSVLGYEFIPVGGVKDKGIDGFQGIYGKKGSSKIVFQLSTEKNYKSKISKSIEKLVVNKIDFDNFTYVTNRKIRNKDKLIDELYEKYQKSIRVFDQEWFVNYSNHSQATINAYYTFIDSYLHEFTKPGKTFIVKDLDNDSRLFVFLRQQFENNRQDTKLDSLLADSLILFGLEGTDPNLGIFRTKKELTATIETLVKFDPILLEKTFDKRLQVLSNKPRKINYHSDQDAYCLPYETRMCIAERNLHDNKVLDDFNKQAEKKLKKYLKDADVKIKDLSNLINFTINKIYYEQGLEFANFILKKGESEILERNLQEIISKAVDESTTILKNKESIKNALLMAIRDMVYDGTPEQHKYFTSLSNTYLMMFLLHWDPNISLYFESVASNLTVYVGTSIIIPALSEIYLEPANQRHINLLRTASKAGVNLIINETILNELIGHFQKIRKRYYTEYRNNEETYLMDEFQTLFMDEIIIRAYFYSKKRNKVKNFEEFLDNFVTPSLYNIENELILYLFHEFGIKYVSDKSLQIRINDEEFEILVNRLEGTKRNRKKAETDAKLILTVYELRNKNNEIGTTSIFGYKTWWLSKDTKTFEAIKEVLGTTHKVSCYLRPDFLYNYISLTPKSSEVESLYKQIFPSLLGINLSFHLPPELQDFIKEKIEEFRKKSPTRLKQIVRNLSERLMTDPKNISKKKLQHFFEEIDDMISKDVKLK